MPRQFKLTDAIPLHVATALPTAYGAGWTSDALDSRGLAKVKLLLTVSGGFDGASIEIKGQVVEGGSAYDEHKASDGALDEAILVIAADGSYSLEYSCGSFDECQFLAKRTGGTQGDLQLSVLGG